VLAYFDQVMQQRFLSSVRGYWFAMSEYAIGADEKHQVGSLTSGNSRQITVRKKVVDATHAHTAVLSTRPPKYAVAPGVRCVPLNQLQTAPHAACTVVGLGKTGMDAILWLLENGVPPSSLRWVMPRDAWLIEPRQHPAGHREFRAQLWRQSGAVRRDPWRPSPSPTCLRGWKRASCWCVSTRTCCPWPPK
jgi:hypothetical protein